ncbi:MAG: hypothetical protein ACLRMZ_10570 [Blautia marasmi]
MEDEAPQYLIFDDYKEYVSLNRGSKFVWGELLRDRLWNKSKDEKI